MQLDPIIKVRNLHKSFGEQEVLRGVDLDVERGKITVIIGKSGSGKTVLLRHVIGLIRPDKGEIWIDGVEITKLKEHQLNEIRKKFGMLFQEAALFDSLNVFENVAFPLREHTRLKEEEIERRVRERLSQVELQGFEEKMPAELSGGMKKRVGLARALILDPEIVLFDEPTASLDPLMSLSVAGLIRHTQLALKKTYLIISHDIFVMFRIAHRIALLSEGRIVDYGTPEEIMESENEVTREFLGARRALI